MSNIILCGCGALGSHIAMGIGREENFITFYDDDKVAQENVNNGTSVYPSSAIGKQKMVALAVMLNRKYNTKAAGVGKTITSSNQLSHKIEVCDLAIDCFDNVEARACTVGLECPTVHISIGEHGIGAIEWDDVFQLPDDGYARGENPVCTNELGRNLILFTSAVASVIINKYLSTGVKESAYVNVENLEVYK